MRQVLECEIWGLQDEQEVYVRALVCARARQVGISTFLGQQGPEAWEATLGSGCVKRGPGSRGPGPGVR